MQTSKCQDRFKGFSASETSTIFDEPIPFIANVTTTNYSGPTHADFSVDFVDSTVSIDPFDFNWTWLDGSDYFPFGTTTMSHTFSVENIGQNNVYVILTNLAKLVNITYTLF